MNKFEKTKLHLNQISDSICYAKWLWSDFNIPYGTTASCHLNPPHKIDITSTGDKIFNTDQKILERQQMLQGQKPKGCKYCWELEEKKVLSDRIYKSEDYISNGHDAKVFQKTSAVPHTIAVIFDTLCNFKCVYCDQSQSTTWESDLRKNGPYKKLTTENRTKYQILSKKNYITPAQQNHLTAEFFDYVKTNISQIKEISILGGEPTMSPRFWEFIDYLSGLDAQHLTIGITTNLCPGKEYDLFKLIEYNKYFANINVLGSIENIQQKAEASRFGTKWNILTQNVEMFLENNVPLFFCSTLGALQIEGYLDLHDWRTCLEQKYNRKIGYSMHFVIDPSFQKIEVLPDWYRDDLTIKYKNYMDTNAWVKNTKMEEFILRIVAKLQSKQLDAPYQNDLKSFVQQYASRCGFDLSIYGELANWIKTID